jgi:glycosyltransferase involved in cell wall biosynthesis
MRLCLVTGEYPPMHGGVGDYTARLTYALAERGHEVSVLTRRSDADTHSSLGQVCAQPVQVLRQARGWGWHGLRAVLAQLARTRPDVVHVQYQAAAYGLHPAICLLPLWSPASCVVTYHDLRVPYVFPKAGRLRRWLLLAPARRCPAVIVTNASDRAQLEAVVPPQCLYSIPIGSNIDPRPPSGYERLTWRNQHAIADDELLVVYFGFLSQSKGGEDVVRVVHRLIQAGCPARLLMLGAQVGEVDETNRRYLRTVQDLIERHGLAARVVWTGFQPEDVVSAWLLASDVALLPYRDGVSLRRGSLMAALAHGLPVVSTKLPAMLASADGLTDGRHVRLADVGDIEALRAHVEQLWRNVDQRREMGQAARTVAARFAWPRIAELHEAVYVSVA